MLRRQPIVDREYGAVAVISDDLCAKVFCRTQDITAAMNPDDRRLLRAIRFAVDVDVDLALGRGNGCLVFLDLDVGRRGWLFGQQLADLFDVFAGDIEIGQGLDCREQFIINSVVSSSIVLTPLLSRAGVPAVRF